MANREEYQITLGEANETIASYLDRGLDLEVSRKLEVAGFNRRPGEFVLTYEGKGMNIHYTLTNLLEVTLKQGENRDGVNVEVKCFLSKLIEDYLEDI